MPRMSLIIGFSGRLRSGKDTAATPLIASGWHHASFAAALKDFTVAVNPLVPNEAGNRFYRLAELVKHYGWERTKDEFPEARALLQRVGTEAGRDVLGQDVWVDAAMERLPKGVDAVFTDCRFPNEAAAIQARGGIVIRVERPSLPEPGPDAHPSETALDDFDFDATIRNTGTVADLHAAVEFIVTQERHARARTMAPGTAV